MGLFNSSVIDFKEVMAAVVDASTETKCITEDCPVKLVKVVLVQHQDNMPSIKLKWTNEAGESMFDFRNFSGKTKEALVAQIVAHQRLIALLGYNYRPEEITGFDGINSLMEDMHSKLEGFVSRWIGIEVKKDDKTGYWNVSRYLSINKFVASEEEAVTDDDLPF